MVGTGLYDFTQTISGVGTAPKEALPPEQMTLDVENNGYKLRVMFQNVNITFGDDPDAGADYGLIIMFGSPLTAQQ